ncbi:MAG: TIGR01777 family protein [SAR324 cluster bacterium]|nr:TIGR01777 family protein [SAR324 cluster bacterium]
MKILITGASGLVGKALVHELEQRHEIVPLSRTQSSGKPFWNPEHGVINPKDFEGVEAVIHLAGESIVEGRWSEEIKDKILNSRVHSTRLLVDTLAQMPQKPAVLISASAVGYYGNRGDAWLDENSSSGTGFLPEVCRHWENASQPATAAGIRLVNTRIGLVLSKHGGALKRMLLPFKLGVGGQLGSGHQYMSWIAINELTRIFEFLINHREIKGPVNVTAPNPVTNAEFTSALGKALFRPAILKLPAFLPKMAIGEVADELLFASARVRPQKLLDAGYSFQYDTILPALKAVTS